MDKTKPLCNCSEDSPCPAHGLASQHGNYLRIKAQIESDQRMKIDEIIADMQWPIYVNNSERAQKLSDELYEKGMRVK